MSFQGVGSTLETILLNALPGSEETDKEKPSHHPAQAGQDPWLLSPWPGLAWCGRDSTVWDPLCGTQSGKPCLAEMDAPQQLCSYLKKFFLPCAGLGEHSHVLEGERGHGRNQALSSCSSRPTSGSLMLPWQTALALWLLEPLFLVSGSSWGSVVPRTLGRALPWLLGTERCVEGAT